MNKVMTLEVIMYVMVCVMVPPRCLEGKNTSVSYIISWTSEAFIQSFSSLHCVREARGRWLAAAAAAEPAGASWNALTSEGSWTHARACVNARARDGPSHSCLACARVSFCGAGARSHGSRLWNELRQAGGHEKSVCTHGPRTWSVMKGGEKAALAFSASEFSGDTKCAAAE